MIKCESCGFGNDTTNKVHTYTSTVEGWNEGTHELCDNCVSGHEELVTMITDTADLI